MADEEAKIVPAGQVSQWLTENGFDHENHEMGTLYRNIFWRIS